MVAKDKQNSKQTDKIVQGAKKSNVAQKPSMSEEEKRKNKADTAKYDALSKTESKNSLKKLTCFPFQKGKCKKGTACQFLHWGDVGTMHAKKVEAAIANKRKRAEKPGSDKAGKKDKKAKVENAKQVPKRTSWKCTGCGNKNWLRRTVCNGAVCGTLRPEGAEYETNAPEVKPSTRGAEQSDQPSTKVFLRNLSYNTTEETMKEFFRDCGTIVDQHFLKDKSNDKINAAFVEFESVDEAQRAVALGGTVMAGRPVRVNFAFPKQEEQVCRVSHVPGLSAPVLYGNP